MPTVWTVNREDSFIIQGKEEMQFSSMLPVCPVEFNWSRRAYYSLRFLMRIFQHEWILIREMSHDMQLYEMQVCEIDMSLRCDDDLLLWSKYEMSWFLSDEEHLN